MKKCLPFLGLAFLLAACGSQADKTETKTLQTAAPAVADTAGLAQFQQWRAQNELNATQQPVQTQAERQTAQPEPQVRTVIREVRVVERSTPVRRKASVPRKEPVANTPATSEEKTATTAGSGSETASTGGGSGQTSDAGTTQETAKKEGWSKAAKGAAIGGAGGAVIGAVISKNKAAGAVIGGIIGGAAGYGIGKSKDKKDGRN